MRHIVERLVGSEPEAEQKAESEAEQEAESEAELEEDARPQPSPCPSIREDTSETHECAGACDVPAPSPMAVPSDEGQPASLQSSRPPSSDAIGSSLSQLSSDEDEPSLSLSLPGDGQVQHRPIPRRLKHSRSSFASSASGGSALDMLSLCDGHRALSREPSRPALSRGLSRRGSSRPSLTRGPSSRLYSRHNKSSSRSVLEPSSQPDDGCEYAVERSSSRKASVARTEMDRVKATAMADTAYQLRKHGCLRSPHGSESNLERDKPAHLRWSSLQRLVSESAARGPLPRLCQVIEQARSQDDGSFSRSQESGSFSQPPDGGFLDRARDDPPLSRDDAAGASFGTEMAMLPAIPISPTGR